MKICSQFWNWFILSLPACSNSFYGLVQSRVRFLYNFQEIELKTFYQTMRICFLTILVLYIFSQTQAQTRRWALGFKLGEPTGLNIRKYGDRNALDLTLGTYGGLFAQSRPYRKGYYQTTGLMFNGTYLWYAAFFNGHLTTYAGLGAQVNSRRYYEERQGVVNVYDRSISIGPSGTAGLEYFSRAKSSSFFMEVGGYAEFIPDFMYISPQISVGARTNF